MSSNDRIPRSNAAFLTETQNGGATIAQIPDRRPPHDQTSTISPPQQHSMVNQVSYANNSGNLSYSQQPQQPLVNTQFQNRSYANQPQMVQPYYDPYQQQQQQQQYMHNNQNSYYAWPTSQQQSHQYQDNFQRQHHYVNPPYPQQQMMTHNYAQQVPYGRASTDNTMSMPTKKRVTLKLVILGNSGVGKTSLMNRYHSNKFTGQYKATIGADFVSKQLILPTNGSGAGSSAQNVTLTIWDTAGQERFQSLGKAFYRGSDVCVLVYDVTDRMSFDGLQKWKDEFDSCLNGGSAPGGMMQNRLQNGSVVGDKLKFVVIANKADKDYQTWSVTREEGMRYAKSISSDFFECSAKTALNVEQAFLSAAKAGLEYNMQKQLSMNASMMMQGGQGGMRGYMPPQRTVDLNRGQSSMSDEGDCC